jgi:flagellar FliL protein
MSADAQTPPADSSPSKGKSSLPFILALVVGLAAGAGAGLFVVGPAMANGITPVAAAEHHAKKKAVAEEDESSSDEAAADEDSDDEESADDSHSKKEGEGAGSEVYTLDNLVLNPAESGGTRFLLLSITFQSSSASVLEAMKSKDAELRDVVLVTLGAKTVEQLADMSTRDSLKSELAIAAKKLLKKKSAKIKVYFPQFVIQ